MDVLNNQWLKIKGREIGPEIGIGHKIGHALDEPVLILKSCNGNRSLGWDLLPPGSKGFEYSDNGTTYTYAGYKESPNRWVKGTTPQPIGWYAGKQYDIDIGLAKSVLVQIGTYYPGAGKYEIAGFFFWHGWKDAADAGHASHYEQNLVQLIEQVRRDFAAPKVPVVCATLCETAKGSGGNAGKILDAQLAVDGESGRYPQFKGNVATVYTNPHSHGGTAGSQYDGKAQTFMDVGLAMGDAMLKLLRPASSASATAPDVTPAAVAQSGKSLALFDGRTLTGWTTGGDPASFTVEDGCIKAVGPKGNLIYTGIGTAPAWTDFDLSMKVKTGDKANSGVWIHCPAKASAENAVALEVQIANETAETQKTGSIFNIARINSLSAHNGQWFNLRVVVRGATITVWLDGVKINEWTQPANWVPPTGVPNARLGKGSIGIQGYGGNTWIKDVRITIP
jgi:hypothetical protein